MCANLKQNKEKKNRVVSFFVFFSLALIFFIGIKCLVVNRRGGINKNNMQMFGIILQ